MAMMLIATTATAYLVSHVIPSIKLMLLLTFELLLQVMMMMMMVMLLLLMMVRDGLPFHHLR